MPDASLAPRVGLETVQTYTPGKPIEELQRERGLPGRVIKMASNENPFGPSPKALRAARRALARVHRYPDGSAWALRRALSKRFRIDPDRIVLGNGSDEILLMALRAFLGPQEEAVMATPSFLIYRIATLVHGGRAIEVPVKNLRYDLGGMAGAVSEKTRVIFVANPDNPLGTYVTARELEAFLGRVPPRCLVVLDEAYYEFARGRKDYPKSFDYLDRPNVLITRTFSKAYGLAGLRIGYGFTSPQVARALNKVREPFNVNLVAQEAALGALGDDAFVRRTVAATEREKARLRRGLGRLGIEAPESVTNFLLVRTGPRSGEIYEGLLRAGVIVRLMRDWGLADFLRVTVGAPAENGIFLRTFARVWKAIEGRKKR